MKVLCDFLPACATLLMGEWPGDEARVKEIKASARVLFTLGISDSNLHRQQNP